MRAGWIPTAAGAGRGAQHRRSGHTADSDIQAIINSNTSTVHASPAAARHAALARSREQPGMSSNEAALLVEGAETARGAPSARFESLTLSSGMALQVRCMACS